jgi:hypothetical protein
MDGVPSAWWTLAEFDRLIEVLTEEDRVELVQGELVPLLAAPLAIRLGDLDLA